MEEHEQGNFTLNEPKVQLQNAEPSRTTVETHR